MIGIFSLLSMTLTIVHCLVTETYLTDDTGTFSSPNFPNEYGTWEENKWTIQVTPPKVIKLVFLAFDLEPNVGGCQSCNCDYVTVDDSQGPISANKRYCGTSIPSSFVSCGSSLIILFKSDDFRYHPGFNATYTTHLPGPKKSDGECTAIEEVTTSDVSDGRGIVKERFRKRNESRNTTIVSDQLNNMSRIRCATWCLRAADCVGFIYYRADLLCKLLNMVELAENDRCAESNTFVCFEKV